MKRFWRAALLLSASWIATPAAADPISTMVALVSNGVAFGTALTATFGAVGAFLIKMTAALAFTALTRAKVDKPKPAGITTEYTKTGGTNGQTFILGTYATAGTHACPPMWHDRPTHQADNPYLTYVIDVADLPGHDISRVAINGEWVEFGPNAFEFTELYGDRALGKYADDDRYGSHAWLRWHDGTQVAADEMLLDYYSDFPRRPWSTDHIGTGVAYAVMTFQHKPRLFSGLPQVRFEVLGLPLYDPRKDSTVGGSGAQRWSNRATWQRTQNPAVMIYNILRGISLPDGSIWGGECEAEDLPLGNWFTAMNVCDEPVTLAAGGTEPRYRAGIEIDVAEDQPADIIEMLLDACSGAISESGGTYRMRAGGPGLPVYVFSDEDLLVTSPQDYVPFPGLDESHNGCHATYPDPRSVWEQRDAKPYYRADYQAQDQGRQIVASVQLPACPYHRQVQRLMRAWIEDDRRWRRHNLALGPYACMLEALDIVAWSSARNGYENKAFEIDQSGVALMTCHTALAVREVDPTDYGWTPGFELPDDPGEPGYDIPPPLAVPGFDVLGVSIEDATSAARRPALRLIWDGTQVAADAALSWEVRLSGGADVLFRGTVADANSGRVQIAGGILPATTYQARARLETPRRQLQWTAWEAALTPNTRLTGDDLSPGAIEDAIADRLAELDAAADAAAQEAQDAAAAAAGVRADHDNLVAGFTGTLSTAFSALDAELLGITNNLTTVTANLNAVYNSSTGQVKATALTGYYTKSQTESAISAQVSSLSATILTPGGQVRSTLLTSYYTSAQTDAAITAQVDSLESQILNASGQVRSSLLTGYYTAAQTDSAISAVQTTLTGQINTGNSNLQGQITNILGLNISPTSALAVTLTDLVADVGVAQSSITAQGSAIADLEGNASAGYLIRAQAGGSVSLLDLVAADGSAGSASVAKLAADTILLDGTVSLPQLVVTDFSGNVVLNGAMPYGDTRGWTGVPTTFAVIPKSDSPAVLSSSPTPYVLRMLPDAATQVVAVGRCECKPGQRFTSAFDWAAASTGAGINLTAGLRFLWYNASGGFISQTPRGLAITGSGWGSSTGAVAEAPAGAAYVIIQAYRAAGGVGAVYITNMEVLRQRSGSLLIAPQSITGAELIATEAVITQEAQIGALTVGSAAIRELAVDTIHVAGDAITTLDVVNFATVTVSAGSYVAIAALSKSITVGDKITIIARCGMPNRSTSQSANRTRLRIDGATLGASEVYSERIDNPEGTFTPYVQAYALIATSNSIQVQLQGLGAGDWVGVSISIFRSKK